jgi:hypothetical protein
LAKYGENEIVLTRVCSNRQDIPSDICEAAYIPLVQQEPLNLMRENALEANEDYTEHILLVADATLQNGET